MNIYQLFVQHVANTPDKTAVVDHETSLSYSELKRLVEKVAHHLERLGVEANSRVALFCPNNRHYATILLAISKLGAALVPLPLTLKQTALDQAITSADCQFAIAWPTIAAELLSRQLMQAHQVVNLLTPGQNEHSFDDWLQNPTIDHPKPSNAAADAPFILTLTSGSTGAPKPIVLTQACKIRRALDATASVYALTERDCVLVSTPLYHSLAQRSLLLPLMLGATAVIMPKFSAPAWINTVRNHKVSFLFAVSSQLRALIPALQTEHIGDSLRHVVSSSASLSADDKHILIRTLNCRLHECYGASELGVVSSFDITTPGAKVSSVGRPLPGIEVKITDQERNTLATGKHGEIACKSPTAFSGYFKQPAMTQAALDESGFFYTGDCGYLDDEGNLYFVSRIKEIIKSGGISIFPSDIEQCFMSLPGIKACAAIGIADEKFDEIILLAYELDCEADNLDNSVLVRHAMMHLTDYQQPRIFRQFDQLPRTELGKILKPKIKEALANESV